MYDPLRSPSAADPIPEGLSGDRDKTIAECKRIFLKAAVEPPLLRAGVVHTVKDWLDLQNGEKTSFHKGPGLLRGGNTSSYSLACACAQMDDVSEEGKGIRIDLLKQALEDDSLRLTYSNLSSAVTQVYDNWAQQDDVIVFHCCPKERPGQTGSCLFVRHYLGKLGLVPSLDDVEYIEAVASLREGLLRTYKRQIDIMNSAYLNHDHTVAKFFQKNPDKYVYGVVCNLYCSASAENGSQAIAASLVSEQLIALEERAIEFSRSRFLAARAASSFMSRALNISSSFPFNLSSGVM